MQVYYTRNNIKQTRSSKKIFYIKDGLSSSCNVHKNYWILCQRILVKIYKENERRVYEFEQCNILLFISFCCLIVANISWISQINYSNNYIFTEFIKLISIAESKLLFDNKVQICQYRNGYDLFWLFFLEILKNIAQ